MRLRPNGDSGPLVASFDMLENYFITQGREWERYAWIKARVMTGIRSAELADIARPFIFRKYLDFGAINAMRDLHAQIRREVARKDMANNVKLGPGGIREIEFLAQVFPAHPRRARHRCRSSPPSRCSTACRARHHHPRGQQQLAAAYDFLRRVEHRLQYLDDAQTTTCPATPTTRPIVARGDGWLRQLRGPARRTRRPPGDRRQTLRQRLRQPHRGRPQPRHPVGQRRRRRTRRRRVPPPRLP